jgi:hypothetical protein
MTNKYLVPFLKKRGIHIKETPIISELVTQGGAKGIISKIKSFGTRLKKSIVGVSKEAKLALKITNTIKKSLQNVSQKKAVDKDNSIQIDKLFVSTPIDLDYGGGFLVFDSNFQIRKLIHMATVDNDAILKVQDVVPNINISIDGAINYDINQIRGAILDVIKPNNISS